MQLARRQNHARHARIQRQFGQSLAYGREAVVVKHSAQLIQQLKTIGDGFGARRFQKRKVGDVAQVQRHHAQYHPGQRAAQYFRLGETRSAVEIFFVVQAYANTVGDTATATGALVGR